MKLAVIGGGSTYTPELADGIGRLAAGQVTELVLVDPDPDRLAVVGPGVGPDHGARTTIPADVSWTDRR